MAGDGIRFLFVDGYDIQIYPSMEKLLYGLEPWAVEQTDLIIVDTEARFYHLVRVGTTLQGVEHTPTEAEERELRECLQGHIRHYWPQAIMPLDTTQLIAYFCRVEL